MRNKIFIYSDTGVSQITYSHTFNMLEKTFIDRYNVFPINAEEVILGHWKENAAMFVIPGGADLEYAKKLNGVGNQKIKEFVSSGGIYLGICAGAYYASSQIEFDKGGELEVVGPRELSFFSGKSIGPALSFYTYNSNEGAVNAKIICSDGNLLNLYLHGGGYFEDAEHCPNVEILATYLKTNGEKLPAIIRTKYGCGYALLSGVHFEINPFNIEEFIYAHNSKSQDLAKVLQAENYLRESLIYNILFANT